MSKSPSISTLATKDGGHPLSVGQHLSRLTIHLVGYGSLTAFAWFLLFAAKRYHSVYGWAHQQDRNISPEQFFQSAGRCHCAILLVAALAGYLTYRDKYLPGKFIGAACILGCLLLFLDGCGKVSSRF